MVFWFAALVSAGGQTAYQASHSLRQIAQEDARQGAADFLVLGVSAAGSMALCSMSSPLYPLNIWVDSNCFMTVGKSILAGKVPYRDLYEQKGPLIYALHAAAALVCRTGFLGVYFLETAAAFFFLYYSWRILQMFCGRRAIVYVPVLAAAAYTANTFVYGDSAEELCLPLLSYALWLGLRALRDRRLPGFAAGAAIGLTSGCVLWIKFSLLGFYLGWFLALVVLLHGGRQIGAVLRMIGGIVLGAAVSTLPWLLYFGANGALTDWFTVYFYDNLIYYAEGKSGKGLLRLLSNLGFGAEGILDYFTAFFFLAALGLVWMLYKKQRELLVYGSALFFMQLLLAFGGGQHHRYYSFVFAPLMVFGLAALDDLLHRAPRPAGRHPGRQAGVVLSALGGLAACFLLSANTPILLQYGRQDLPQYQFKAVIDQTPDAVMLNYGVLDLGVYTVCGIVPDCRYFCGLNSKNPAIMQGQKEYVRSQAADYIVMCWSPQKPEEMDNARSFLEENDYDCAMITEFRDDLYFLYRRSEA